MVRASRYVKGKDGKFAGSVGAGKDSVPVSQRGSTVTVDREPTAATQASGISEAFARFETTTATAEFDYSYDDAVIVYELERGAVGADNMDFDGFATKLFPLMAPQDRTRFAVQYLNVNTRKFFATSIMTSTDMLEALSRDPDREVVKYVATNPLTPTEVLDHFARNESEHIRAKVSQNPSLSNAGKVAVLTDTHPRVRESAARHIELPPRGVERVLASDDVFVKRGLACSASVGTKTLAKLATDADGNVRRLAVSNPRCGREVLWMAQYDKNPSVASAAKRAFEALVR